MTNEILEKEKELAERTQHLMISMFINWMATKDCGIYRRKPLQVPECLSPDEIQELKAGFKEFCEGRK